MKWLFSVLALLAVSVSCACALADDVILIVDIVKLPGNRVRLSGKTNLPPGTKLMLSVREKTENGFLGQSSCFVSGEGVFDSEAFGPSSGLKDGRYVAEATMPIPAVQPAAVKQIIGNNGEKLTGSLVEKDRFGVTVSQETEFAIGDSPDAAQAERSEQSDDAAAKLRKQLCTHLEELLEFKGDEKFKQFGFGTGGPYSKWLKSIEAIRDAQPTGAHPIPLILRAAPGDLLMLGMDYMRKGDAPYTREILPELKHTIGYEAYLKNKKRHTAATPEFRTWRDTTGKFSVDAALVSVDEDTVVLRKKNGQTVNVPVAKLSGADVEFVKRQREN
ncbi:MAG: SHD1 domain-containing protein [Pirellulaceae bacterium]